MFERIYRSRRDDVLFAVIRRSKYLYLVVEWQARNESPTPYAAFRSYPEEGNEVVGPYLGVPVTLTTIPKDDAIACAKQAAAMADVKKTAAAEV